LLPRPGHRARVLDWIRCAASLLRTTDRGRARGAFVG
jgi:hypothetical protein